MVEAMLKMTLKPFDLLVSFFSAVWFRPYVPARNAGMTSILSAQKEIKRLSKCPFKVPEFKWLVFISLEMHLCDYGY